MGFDIYGLDPQTEKGHYFRNNVWYWRPLWSLICHHCEDILTEEEMEYGNWNDGRAIQAKTAIKIYKRLINKIDIIKDEINEYEKERKKDNGSHPASLDNVLEFIDFCKNSGGFTIH